MGGSQIRTRNGYVKETYFWAAHVLRRDTAAAAMLTVSSEAIVVAKRILTIFLSEIVSVGERGGERECVCVYDDWRRMEWLKKFPKSKERRNALYIIMPLKNNTNNTVSE